MHKLTVCWQPGLHRIRHSHGHFLLAVTRFGFKAAPSMLLITIKQCFRILANQIGIKIIIIISTIIDHHRSSQSSQPVNKCLNCFLWHPWQNWPISFVNHHTNMCVLHITLCTFWQSTSWLKQLLKQLCHRSQTIREFFPRCRFLKGSQQNLRKTQLICI